MTSVVVDHRLAQGGERRRAPLGDITNNRGGGVKKPITKPKAGENTKKPLPFKTLSSTLSARSKAAGNIATKPKPKAIIIDDIDESDKNNELAQVEYVDQICKFYKETQGSLRDYMDSQPDINARMRAILLDWLVQVHSKYDGLMPETLYLTINIVDRYLSLTSVDRTQLQLVGVSALFIASKYEQIWPLAVHDMIILSDSIYSRDQVLAMEKSILTRLGWYLTVPTPYVFAVRYAKASLPTDNQMQNMVFFFTELGLMDYLVTIRHNPSLLAASAVYAARCTLNKTPAWTETLKHYTGYTADQLLDCAKSLVRLHASAPDDQFNAVYRKYLNPDRGAVARFPPATSLLS